MKVSKNLLQRACNFEEEALTEFYQLLMPGLYRYALRLLSNQELAEECVADSFSRLLQAWHRGVGPRENPRAYLYRIAHNWVTDYYRSCYPREMSLEIFANLLEEPIRPSSLVEQKQEHERLCHAISLLTPEQQQVVILKYLEGWTNQEIADSLEKSIGAVKSLQNRGVAALQRMLVQSIR